MKSKLLILSTAVVVLSNLSNLQASNQFYNEQDAIDAAIAASLVDHNEKIARNAYLDNAETNDIALALRYDAEAKRDYQARLAAQEEEELQAAIRASEKEAIARAREAQEAADLALALKLQEELNSPAKVEQKVNNSASGLNQQFSQMNIGGNRNSQVISNAVSPMEAVEVEEITLSLPLTVGRPPVKVEPEVKNVANLSRADAEKLNEKNLNRAILESEGTLKQYQLERMAKVEEKNKQNLNRHAASFSPVSVSNSISQPAAKTPVTVAEEKGDKYAGTGRSYGTYLEEEKKREKEQQSAPKVAANTGVQGAKNFFENLNKKEEPKKPLFSNKK